MLTTMRSLRTENNETNSNVDLLEKNYVETPNNVEEENIEEVRARMHRNLEQLLNYDRENEVVKKVITEEKIETKVEDVALSDDDIKPTSTTMQFGDGNIDQVYNEMPKKTEEKSDYKLTKKGKVLMAVYSLVVAIVFALIVLNTGVLATLAEDVTKGEADLYEKIETYNTVKGEIEEISSDSHIIEVAEDELGMIKG